MCKQMGVGLYPAGEEDLLEGFRQFDLYLVKNTLLPVFRLEKGEMGEAEGAAVWAFRRRGEGTPAGVLRPSALAPPRQARSSGTPVPARSHTTGISSPSRMPLQAHPRDTAGSVSDRGGQANGHLYAGGGACFRLKKKSQHLWGTVKQGAVKWGCLCWKPFSGQRLRFYEIN